MYFLYVWTGARYGAMITVNVRPSEIRGGQSGSSPASGHTPRKVGTPCLQHIELSSFTLSSLPLSILFLSSLTSYPLLTSSYSYYIFLPIPHLSSLYSSHTPSPALPRARGPVVSGRSSNIEELSPGRCSPPPLCHLPWAAVFADPTPTWIHYRQFTI